MRERKLHGRADAARAIRRAAAQALQTVVQDLERAAWVSASPQRRASASSPPQVQSALEEREEREEEEQWLPTKAASARGSNDC
mmetsp:Transcript_75602/g.122080  ORF Transcript_75602/g.122080 Transcript_75602/m.122080 type:complete len:84 (+) Transcript_75602:225-476(+)